MGSSSKTVRQIMGVKRKASEPVLKSAAEATVAAIMEASQKPLIFISWSGEPERNIALELQKFLETGLPVRTFVSSRDIQSNGTGWKDAINDALREASYGIICMTERNKEAPWIMYESGALDGILNFENVSLIAFDFEESAVPVPFTNKHVRRWNKKSFQALLNDVCSGLHLAAHPQLNSHMWFAISRKVRSELKKSRNEMAERDKARAADLQRRYESETPYDSTTAAIYMAEENSVTVPATAQETDITLTDDEKSALRVAAELSPDCNETFGIDDVANMLKWSKAFAAASLVSLLEKELLQLAPAGYYQKTTMQYRLNPSGLKIAAKLELLSKVISATANSPQLYEHPKDKEPKVLEIPAVETIKPAIANTDNDTTCVMELVKIIVNRTVPLDGENLKGRRYYWLAADSAALLQQRAVAKIQDPDSIVYMAVDEENGVDAYGHHKAHGWSGQVRLGYAVDLQQKYNVHIYTDEYVGFRFIRGGSVYGKTVKTGDIVFYRLNVAQDLDTNGWGLHGFPQRASPLY